MKYDEINASEIGTESYPDHFEEIAEDENFTDEDLFSRRRGGGTFTTVPRQSSRKGRISTIDRTTVQNIERLLQGYFKRTPTHLKEEVEIPAKIKKCEFKIKQITSYLETLETAPTEEKPTVILTTK